MEQLEQCYCFGTKELQRTKVSIVGACLSLDMMSCDLEVEPLMAMQSICLDST